MASQLIAKMLIKSSSQQKKEMDLSKPCRSFVPKLIEFQNGSLRHMLQLYAKAHRKIPHWITCAPWPSARCGNATVIAIVASKDCPWILSKL